MFGLLVLDVTIDEQNFVLVNMYNTNMEKDGGFSLFLLFTRKPR